MNKNVTKIEKVDFWRRKVLPELSGNDIIRLLVLYILYLSGTPSKSIHAKPLSIPIHFLVTKKGCEFIAHKMTGQKGTEFTARYINRFHEMEEGKLPCPLNPQIASSVAELGRVTERVMKNQGSAPYKIAEAFKMECEQFGIQLPADFVKVPEYEQMALSEFIK